MTKEQMATALRKHNQREMAKHADRIVVSNYPYSHNPYLPHYQAEDCAKVCIPMLMNLAPGKLP